MLAVCCVIALFLSCFWPVLFRGEQFGYRDAGHYYYPLYQRVQQEWSKHRLPLWDARENAGMPLLGNPTAAVLYPGKLIYAVLPYPWAARAYIIAHVLLAFVGMYRLMRGWGTSPAGSAASAIAYSFGAPILFQYCNVIFLVGAAWVPFGFAAMDRWLRTGHRASIAILGVVLAMQTLGGDPEAAYVTGLCGGGYAIGLAIARRRELRATRPIPMWLILVVSLVVVTFWTAAVIGFALAAPPWRPKGPPVGPLPWSRWWSMILTGLWVWGGLIWLSSRTARRGPSFVRFAGLGAAGLIGGLLCAGQLLPVMEFTSRTMRATPDGPHDIYPFSVEPYRMAEWLWPEVFGSNFQANRTWGILLPPQHISHTWVPSLYVGGLTLVLALSAVSLRGLGARRVWLSWVAIVSMIAALGEYAGPLWIARCIPAVANVVGPHDLDTSAIRKDAKVRDGDGSVYGLMAVAIPGFGGFRYPGKLLTFTCLGVAGLAGIGLDRMLAGRSRVPLRIAVFFAGVSVTLLIGSMIGREGILRWFDARKSLKGSSAFGPFDAKGAWLEIRNALLHGTICMVLCVDVFVMVRRWPRLATSLVLLIVTADLAVANSKLVLTVPQTVFEVRPEVLTKIAEAEAADPSPGPFRVHRMPYWVPTGFHDASSPSRYRELVEWERRTLEPKYGVPLGISYTLTEGVAELYDYSWFFAPFLVERNLSGGANTNPNEPGLVYFPRKGFDLWGSRYFVVPAIAANDERRANFTFLFDADPVAPTRGKRTNEEWAAFLKTWVKDKDWRVYKNKKAFPRTWIVHQVEFRSPIEGNSRKSREERSQLMMSLVYANDMYWKSANRQVQDLRAKAFVELENQTEFLLSFRGTDPAETVRIISGDDDQKVVIEADLTSPGLIVLADVYYPGWELYIDNKPAPIYRTNRMMRGAAVGAGHHRLVYIYNPQSARLGLSISAFALFLTGGILIWCRSRPTSPKISKLLV